MLPSAGGKEQRGDELGEDEEGDEPAPDEEPELDVVPDGDEGEDGQGIGDGAGCGPVFAGDAVCGVSFCGARRACGGGPAAAAHGNVDVADEPAVEAAVPAAPEGEDGVVV